MSKQFTRTIEDFICEHCGTKVFGNGYTNHCPNCLCSKDVDVNPGDRKSTCGGIMRPVSIELKNGNNIIVHRCEKCGKERKNKSAPNDNFDKILSVMKKISP